MSTTEQLELQQKFFSSPEYAVVGASKDQNKYGTKAILKWYKTHGKTITPIHPKEGNLEGFDTLRRLSDLTSPNTTSVSIVTPPSITLDLLKEAKNLDIPVIWLQPGAEDDAVKKYIIDANLEDKVILGGPCVLTDGEHIIKSLL